MSKTTNERSEELEKRLREMLADAMGARHVVPFDLKIALAAARIGAEIEREECAKAAEACREAEDVPDAIRARGQNTSTTVQVKGSK